MSTQNFSDDDFLVTDPAQQPGVVLDVAAGVEPVMLLDGYLSDTIVRCSFCRQRQKHRKGFFVLLPDGSKALCGRCCAITIGGKATVGKIEKQVENRAEKSKRREISAAVLDGIPELYQLVVDEFEPLERRVNDTLEELFDLFPWSFMSRRSDICIARGGLATIMKGCEAKRLTDKEILVMLTRKSAAKAKIRSGIDTLRKNIALLRHDRLRSQIASIAREYDFEKCVMIGDRIEVEHWEYRGRVETMRPKSMTVPVFQVPDATRLMELASRDAA